MKIKHSMIDKELRITGAMLKLINSSFSERRLRVLGKMKPKIKIKDDYMECTEDWITRNNGSKLRVCIFKPIEAPDNLPGVLWLHGGGYAIGYPEQSKFMIKTLIKASDCIVVSPDYRLSVEAPYPAALEDSYCTLLWMKNNAEKLGIRENQLMVAGDSAGGGLTAAITLYARDKGEVEIAFQMPLYPMLDDRMISESAIDNDAPVWSSKSNFNAWKLYLGDLFNSENVPCYASPARAKDYSRLSPTATFVGDLEPFKDETIEYVDNLIKAGVPVEFKLYKGCYHAFEHICPRASISKKAIEFITSSFKYATEHYFAEQKLKIK